MGTQYKRYWYFDKRQSELKYRLLGICPLHPDVYTMNSDEKIILIVLDIFPSAREVLHEAKASMIKRIQQCLFHLIKY
jgi:hypothetical protein